MSLIFSKVWWGQGYRTNLHVELLTPSLPMATGIPLVSQVRYLRSLGFLVTMIIIAPRHLLQAFVWLSPSQWNLSWSSYFKWSTSHQGTPDIPYSPFYSICSYKQLLISPMVYLYALFFLFLISPARMWDPWGQGSLSVSFIIEFNISNTIWHIVSSQ